MEVYGKPIAGLGPKPNVVTAKSDSDVIFYLQLLSNTPLELTRIDPADRINTQVISRLEVPYNFKQNRFQWRKYLVAYVLKNLTIRSLFLINNRDVTS